MTERKVLNKYFPPEYDPSKIPRKPKAYRSRSFSLRTMAPFNMRCNTCSGYIYKAKKFNSRMETAEGETYLGLRVYRFYIKCPTCCAEIVYKTDIENQDYVIESGAKRNFEALRTAEKQEERKELEEEEEEKANPMKALEKRTQKTRNDMNILEALEDLKELNKRHANLGLADKALEMIQNDRQLLKDEAQAIAEAQEKADEEYVRSVFSKDIITQSSTEDIPSTSGTSKSSNAAFKNPLKRIQHTLISDEIKCKSQKLQLKGIVKKVTPKSIQPTVDMLVIDNLASIDKPVTINAEPLTSTSSALSSLFSYGGSDSNSDNDS